MIEQGKVDVLLQSSPKDRRVIFEEASGISRFKAKKIEALRRLERVDQNLLRLGDIVEEVECRLKTVRAQAAKARRYKEHADRLQQLRTQVGLADWRSLGERLAAIDTIIHNVRTEISAATTSAAAAESLGESLEQQIGEVDREIHAAESQLAEDRQRAATMETTIEHERIRTADLDSQTARHRTQLQALSNRASDLAGLWQTTQQELQTAEGRHREVSNHLADQQRALTALTAQLDQIRSENEQRRSSHLEQLRTAAALTSETNTLEGRLSRTDETRERVSTRLSEIQLTRQRNQEELQALAERECELQERLDERSTDLVNARDDLADARRQHAARQKELAGWRERLSGISERAALLEELEKRHRGG